MKIKKVEIWNYKSIRHQEIEFKDLNIMIGGNGVGKSNLIAYFKFMNSLIRNNLREYVGRQGGADDLLYFGRKVSNQLATSIDFINGSNINRYRGQFVPDRGNGLFIKSEQIFYRSPANGRWYENAVSPNDYETGLNKLKTGIGWHVTQAFNDFTIYHFHDTGDSSPMKGSSNVNDNRKLKGDASNIAAFLFKLKENSIDDFNTIESTIQLIAPFFNGFILRPLELTPNEIMLEWNEVGSEKYFNASHFSDGTIRMVCLITLLLQPKPPASIIIDEPELGLHPAAIKLLAELLKLASKKSQIILATQSVTLLNQFSPEDIIVVERHDGQSVFKRLVADDFANWSEEYSLGEIWEKNIIGGRP